MALISLDYSYAVTFSNTVKVISSSQPESAVALPGKLSKRYAHKRLVHVLWICGMGFSLVVCV